MAVNDTLFFFGDSKVAIDNPRSYHDIICDDLGFIDRYWGVGGRTLQSLSTNSPSTNSVDYLVTNNLTSSLDAPTDGIYVHDTRIKYYFTCFGTNDVIQTADVNNSIANFKTKYRNYINKLYALGWPRLKITILNLDIIDFTKHPGNLGRLTAYNQAIKDIAQEFGIRFIDLYSNQVALNNPNGILSSDGLHLSTLGNQVNADLIKAQMDSIPVDPSVFTILKGRRFVMMDGTNPPDSGNSTIELTYETSIQAQAALFSFAGLKYNKEFALTFQKDDGLEGDYHSVYKVLHKGLGFNNVPVTAPTYTDGCGGIVKWKAGFAVFSKGADDTDLHTGTNSSYTTWAEYAEMVRAAVKTDPGYEVMNHGYGGSDVYYTDRGFQLKENERYIYNKLKDLGVQYRVRTVIIPAADEGFNISSVNLNVEKVSSNFGGNSPDNSTSIKYGSHLRLDNYNPIPTLQVTRSYVGDDWSNPTVIASAKQEVDYLFDRTDGNETGFLGGQLRLIFSHGPSSEEAQINGFLNFVNYVKNHPKNGDKLWITTLNEAWDYAQMKNKVILSKVVTGNKVIITVNAEAVPVNTQFLDASLLVTTTGLESVTSNTDHTHNLTTGLINVFRRRTAFNNPSLDAVPPRLVSCNVSAGVPNRVNLIFDRPVTQNIKEAYTVAGFTVSSLTGGGTNWSLNLNGSVTGTTQLSYKAQTGNAVDSTNTSYRVCSYINKTVLIQ